MYMLPDGLECGLDAVQRGRMAARRIDDAVLGLPARVRTRQAEGYGLYSCGLYSYGLYSCGLHEFGLVKRQVCATYRGHSGYGDTSVISYWRHIRYREAFPVAPHDIFVVARSSLLHHTTMCARLPWMSGGGGGGGRGGGTRRVE